jgi:hypothetical protein
MHLPTTDPVSQNLWNCVPMRAGSVRELFRELVFGSVPFCTVLRGTRAQSERHALLGLTPLTVTVSHSAVHTTDKWCFCLAHDLLVLPVLRHHCTVLPGRTSPQLHNDFSNALYMLHVTCMATNKSVALIFCML